MATSSRFSDSLFFLIRVEIQRMVVNLDAEYFFDGFFDGLYSWVTKFNHFTGIGHDNMIVLLVEIGLLVMRLVLSKLVLANQTTI